MLSQSVESGKGLLPPGRAIGLLDLELELDFFSRTGLPMGVTFAVELLCLHLLVKLASTQPVWLTCGWIRLLELTLLPPEWFLRVLGSSADPTLLVSALKLTTRITLSSCFN